MTGPKGGSKAPDFFVNEFFDNTFDIGAKRRKNSLQKPPPEPGTAVL